MLAARHLTAVAVAVCAAFAMACAGGAGGTVDSDTPLPPAARCAALAELDLVDMRVMSAAAVPDGDGGPAHCAVAGVLETEINFEMLLPDDWNGRFVMGGGGGYVGNVQNQAMTPTYSAAGGTPLQRGYATIGTDTGHVGGGVEASWALNNPERQENFGHRAVHLTAEAGKSIARHYYDRPPDYSYFVGCSRGGGQAMMESQRYPDDFDGIVAAAPAYNWTAFTAGFVQTQQAIYPTDDTATPVITSENLALLGSSIIAACDANDGVEDGVMTDPRGCDLRPEDLPRCAGDVSGADCVTAAQLAAIQVVYDGPTANGESIHPGFAYGGENDPGGWDTWVVHSEALAATGPPSLHYGFGTELYKNFVFSDPDWDYTSYDFSTYEQDTAATAEILNATDTDLGTFRDAGGKIIYWTGWSDHALTPLGTIKYVDAVRAGDPGAGDYTRLYMLPGVLHCGGGPGPDSVDWIETIRAWVEEGQAPERLTASKFDRSGSATLTRPVCPYPQVAVYDGAGDPNDEASFACANPS